MHQELSLPISLFDGPLSAPCGCRFYLACDQISVRHSQAPAPGQLDQELLSAGALTARCSGRHRRGRRYGAGAGASPGNGGGESQEGVE